MVFRPSASWAARGKRGARGQLACLILSSSLIVLPSAGTALAKDKKSSEGQSEEKSKGHEPQEGDASEVAVDEEETEASDRKTKDATVSASAADVHPDGGPGNTIFFIDGGIRSDLGTLDQVDVIGRFEEKENFDVKSLGPIFHAGILTKLFWKFRIGVGVGYGFNYTFKERLTKFEKEQEQEPQVWTLGQLHTVDLRLEFSQHLGDAFWLVATPRGGISMIAVGEDLKTETEQYEDSHVVRKGPRLGMIAGGDIGLRYMMTPWFSLRLTGGYVYNIQGLLKASRRGDAADSDHKWKSTVSRVQSNLALEASF